MTSTMSDSVDHKILGDANDEIDNSWFSLSDESVELKTKFRAFEDSLVPKKS